MKKVLSTILALTFIFALTSSALAANEETNIYEQIEICTVITTDDEGNVITQTKTLADCDYFDANGNQVDVSEAITLIYPRSSVTHKPNVSLNSGYMVRYGDYYCTTGNPVSLSCTLGSAAKVAFGYSYTSNPSTGAEMYAATTDSKDHSTSFSVPSNTYYMFYCTNISPGAVTLKTFTISY